MAVHARLGRRNSGVRQLLDRRMTIPAIDSVITNVVFVAELNRLFSRKKGLSVVRRAIGFEQQPDNYRDEEHCPEDADLRDEICAPMKNLTHRCSSTGRL